MTNKTFNLIRFLAEIGITAIGAFYKGIAEVWNLPYGEAVLTTCVLLSTLIGVFTEWQRNQYAKNKALPDQGAASVLPEDLTATVNREEIE